MRFICRAVTPPLVLPGWRPPRWRSRVRLSAIPALSPKWNSRCNPGPQSARGGCGHLAERIGELLVEAAAEVVDARFESDATTCDGGEDRSVELLIDVATATRSGVANHAHAPAVVRRAGEVLIGAVLETRTNGISSAGGALARWRLHNRGRPCVQAKAGQAVAARDRGRHHPLLSGRAGNAK